MSEPGKCPDREMRAGGQKGDKREEETMRRRLGIFSVVGMLTALAVGGFGVLGAGAQTNSGTVKTFDVDMD